MMRLSFYLSLALSLGPLPPSAFAQELEVLRTETRASSGSGPKISLANTRTDRSRKRAAARFDSDCDEDDSWFYEDILGSLMVWAAATPFVVPRLAAGDESFDRGYHLRYPYLHDRDAALVDEFYSVDGSRKLMLRASVDHINDFESLSSTGGSLLLDSASRWGLDTSLNYRRENLASSADDLWTGDANIVFRFAQSEQLQMRAGVGMNFLLDESDTDLGVNLTYGGDWFPAKPLIVSHQLDYGTLNGANLFHGRVTAGINYHRLETYVGYDYFDVGKADIGGLVGGVRLWFAQ